MRILVTNDDGVDSIGLHELARALRPHGEVVIAAPDEEYSGYGAAVGPLHQITPEVHETEVEGIAKAWAVSGPPALCVMFARLGAFGDRFDLVVAGVNPGANVGRSVYHSGTVGACLTARNGGLSGVAVSQSVENFGVEGQGWDDVLANQLWGSAAAVGAAAVGGLCRDLPPDPVVLNINVPNSPIERMKGWRRTAVGVQPPRTMSTATLEPRRGHAGSYRVSMHWGDAGDLPAHTDGGAVMNGWVSVSWLGRIESVTPALDGVDHTETAIDSLLG